MSSFSALLLVVLVAAASAFAPISAPSRSGTYRVNALRIEFNHLLEQNTLLTVRSHSFLLDTFELSPATCLYIDNAYLRGGKPSWEFESDTMYIEQPKAKKAAPKKVVAKKKAAPKKVVAKKGKSSPGVKSIFGF